MSIRHLNVTALRNLSSVTLSPSPQINILFGANGSGKTSLLEAIHLLGLARSFRSQPLQSLIQHGQAQCSAFAELGADGDASRRLGVSRDRQGELQVRINGENARSLAQLAQELPLQLINPNSFRLLEGAPKQRRQFMDWGVFHVEQSFLSTWQRLQRALRQRNAWLRRAKMADPFQAVWDKELCLAGEAIDNYRRSYIAALKPVFEQTLAQLIELDGLVLSYYRGWDKERSLAGVLAASLSRDQQLGATQAGPQRADLRLRLAGNNAADILSRGQQKLVICALHIAQGHLLTQAGRSACVYLVDDLPSELDEQHRRALCGLLEGLGCQVFITCVEAETLQDNWRADTKVALFHVEQGQIRMVGN